jgi:hypothetical protein
MTHLMTNDVFLSLSVFSLARHVADSTLNLQSESADECASVSFRNQRGISFVFSVEGITLDS